ncbi:MAG TPA: hypothetical protein VGV60_02720 [Candidatus Polarisedimenticolia bacterium]|jgi:hypothetical protein|nr:hypothetical protein [Candidatus Polarisedimenticolia bacterium]
MRRALRSVRDAAGWLLLTIAVPTFAPAAPAGGAAPRPPTLGLGYEYDLGSGREEFLLPDPVLDPSIAPDHPLYVRIRAPWSLLEPGEGTYDWSEVDRIVDPYRAAHFVVTLCLYGPNPAIDPGGSMPSPGRPAVLKAWLGFTRAAALHFKGRVRYYEIADAPNREQGWAAAGVMDFAYVLKNTSVVIRSADPEGRIAQGALDLGAESLEADLDWQKALYDQGIATYVDVLPVRPPAGLPIERAIAKASALLLDQDPSAQLWAVRVAAEGVTDRERASDLLGRFITAQGEGAAVVSFDLETDVNGQPEFPGVLLDLHKLFLPTYAPVSGALAFEATGEGAGRRIEGITSYAFFDAGAYQGLVGFFARGPLPERGARVVIPTAAVRGAAIYDIIGGAAGPPGGAVEPDFKSNTTRVPVPLYARPLVLQYSRVAIKGFEAEKEQLHIEGKGLITAEEVITGHQAFMADQRFRLKNYRADAILTYHGKVAGSNTIDVSFDNAFFWDPATGAEWEQRALYYNGVRWKGKKLPELPIPQPEKVFTLPLDINLNKDYVYEYVSEDKVGGFDCHVLEFKPIDRSRNLYEGRAWIETRTFAPVKTSTVQTKLSPPLTSNEEVDFYRPHAGPDGSTYWLLTRVEGQQILSVAGQALVLSREIDFKNVSINDAGFAQAREEAYRSDRQMLRDTREGLRYLERTESGERQVKEQTRKSALLGLAGLYRQPGLDYPVLPLLGAGYFNYDVGGRNVQTTALLGGVINLFSYTDPHLFGKRLDATAQVVTLAVNLTDQLFVQGKELAESNVDARSQSLSGSLGASLGSFMRLKATYGLDYVNYSRDVDSETFVVPRDTFIQSPGIQWEFNRAAWSVVASGQKSFRSRWGAWGDETLPCPSPGSCLSDFDAAQNDYETYEFSVAKQVFLPLFQKLRFEAMWQTGSRLDRFSEFQFSFFGTRVRGFSGSGVRYDRGGIVRAQYAFNIANVVRFDASLDRARVRDVLTSDDYHSFTGLGISGNMMGPWETVLQFDVGVALQSDFEPLKGGTEFQIGLLKYF